MNTFIRICRFLLMASFSIVSSYSICQNSNTTRYIIISINNNREYVEINGVKREKKDTISQQELVEFCKKNDNTRIYARDYNGKNQSKWYPSIENDNEKEYTIQEGTTPPRSTLKNLERLGYFEHMIEDEIKYTEKRIALLIGNNDYKSDKDFGRLNNTDNDIDGVTEKLHQLGFDVYSLYNANTKEMNSAITMFFDSVLKYDVALFYFAGHGIRQHDNHMDYILPIDALDDLKYLNRYPLLSLETFIDRCDIIRNTDKKMIVVVDACRENIDKNKYIVEYEMTPVLDGICLMQSTYPSNKSYDGANGSYSPFASAFIDIIGSTGKSIDDEFNEIVNAVIASSNQHPTIKNTIPRNSFFFYPKDSIPDKMRAKYSKTFEEAKEYFDNKEYGPALHRFRTLPLSFNDSICTYLAVCNYYWDNKSLKADSLFKVADSAYHTKFFNEEYGKYLMRRDTVYREALNNFLKAADTSKAEQKSGIMGIKVKEKNYFDTNNWIKDSIGILYEDLAGKENDSVKKKEYLVSAFLWYERSNSPFARYRRLELVNRDEVSRVSNVFFKYETKQYRQLRRIIKKYNDYDAKYCLGKFNIENSKFSEKSRMQKKGVKWLEEDSAVGRKEAKKLLEQKRENTPDSNSRSCWSIWRDYTREDWKFSDYWGVNVLYGKKGIDIAGHYRQNCLSIGFGYGMFGFDKVKEDDFFSDDNKANRLNYIYEKYVDKEGDFNDYKDDFKAEKPWMIYVETGYNFNCPCLRNLLSFSLGLGALKINRSLTYSYTLKNHEDDEPKSYYGSIAIDGFKGIYFLSYPQLHLHLLSTGIGLGLTIDMGYRFIFKKKRDKNYFLNINEVIEQCKGFTYGMGLEFTF